MAKPVKDKLLSLAEISEVERAYDHGVPALGRAASALLARWRLPLRDDETFLRLAFLCWYAEHEPGWLTGLEDELPGVNDLISERGGEEALSGEALFTLAILWHLSPPLHMSEAAYREKAGAFARRAAEREPTSRVFREWRFFFGEEAETDGPQIYVRPEVHARYHGRGAMGDYMAHTLSARLTSPAR